MHNPARSLGRRQVGMSNEVEVLSSRTRCVLGYALSLGLMVALALLIAFPVGPLSSAADHDAAGHLLGFAILVVPAAALWPRSLTVLIPVFLLFGAAVELIQPFVGREGDWIDMASNVCGLAGGAVIGMVLNRAGRWLLA